MSPFHVSFFEASHWPSGHMTRSWPLIGGQKWTLKVAVKSGPQKWRPKVAAKSGGQKWTPKVAAKSGPQSGSQNWTPKVAAKSGGQKWRPKLAAKSGVQKWRPKVAAKSSGQKWQPKVATLGHFWILLDTFGYFGNPQRSSAIFCYTHDLRRSLMIFRDLPLSSAILVIFGDLW